MTEPKPFRDMTRDEKLALCAALIDGGKIEYRRYDGEWVSLNNPEWFADDMRYRVSPAGWTATEWPWEHMVDWVKFVAMNKGGLWVGYQFEPVKMHVHWESERGAFISLFAIKPIVIGDRSWGQTLTARPDGV
jgi:hypothetical protein